MNTFEKLRKNGIIITQEDIKAIAEKYKIKELSVFGSSVRADFTKDSDIDLLIEFENPEQISLFDLLDIQEYFEKLTKRAVDIVEPAGIQNPYRRNAILSSKEIIYAA
jgi:hypothetical protein